MTSGWTIGAASAILLGLYLIGQCAWILMFRPDPPVGAVTATRRSRTVIACLGIACGMLLIALRLS